MACDSFRGVACVLRNNASKLVHSLWKTLYYIQTQNVPCVRTRMLWMRIVVWRCLSAHSKRPHAKGRGKGPTVPSWWPQIRYDRGGKSNMSALICIECRPYSFLFSHSSNRAVPAQHSSWRWSSTTTKLERDTALQTELMYKQLWMESSWKKHAEPTDADNWSVIDLLNVNEITEVSLYCDQPV
jgi:hypothetical protein